MCSSVLVAVLSVLRIAFAWPSRLRLKAEWKKDKEEKMDIRGETCSKGQPSMGPLLFSPPPFRWKLRRAGSNSF